MAIKQKSDIALPEGIFTGQGDAAADRKILRMADDGVLHKLYQGVYTSNVSSLPEAVVLRNWGSIVSHFLPEGGLSYRSGYDAKLVDEHRRRPVAHHRTDGLPRRLPTAIESIVEQQRCDSVHSRHGPNPEMDGRV
ncbi:hypothetical protein GTP44_07550 [Duganella sp. FT50W]|uniref:Uncharacterized protein n=1 Tax=Duganella lactea TaxID=2692173 RepID=A0A6L8MIR1_9BURK|nr:hypothetical protein [Duganella lactea]MYM81812.1 hypothetical protein [Duganella lactea]